MVAEAVAEVESEGGDAGVGGGGLSAGSPVTYGHAWGGDRTWGAIEGL